MPGYLQPRGRTWRATPGNDEGSIKTRILDEAVGPACCRPATSAAGNSLDGDIGRTEICVGRAIS